MAAAGKARQCRISVKSEEGVLLAAKGLGVQASHVDRSLRSRKSGLNAILVAEASNPVFAATERGAAVRARQHGLSIEQADETITDDQTTIPIQTPAILDEDEPLACRRCFLLPSGDREVDCFEVASLI
ncbi:hypothetical protein [Lacipirellula sp.]|uniref:hypothetical protein n=1 Tax=Lacipirellula sp. TaxID=2691419 RepID=UPI003D141198